MKMIYHQIILQKLRLLNQLEDKKKVSQLDMNTILVLFLFSWINNKIKQTKLVNNFNKIQLKINSFISRLNTIKVLKMKNWS